MAREIDELIERLGAQITPELLAGARDDIDRLFTAQGVHEITDEHLEGALIAIVGIIEMQLELVNHSPWQIRKLLQPRLEAMVHVAGAIAAMRRGRSAATTPS